MTPALSTFLTRVAGAYDALPDVADAVTRVMAPPFLLPFSVIEESTLLLCARSLCIQVELECLQEDLQAHALIILSFVDTVTKKATHVPHVTHNTLEVRI